MPDSVRPLEGLKVVEVGVWHAGPGAGAILADLGAEVIKIESLEGDQTRHTGKFGPLKTGDLDRDGWTVLFDLSNRGKKSVSIDLRQQAGQDILRALVADADAFITNLRTSTKPKMGLDYATLSAVNPRLIHLSVTGFGPKGELADQGAFDTLAQALSGMMFSFGGDEPAPASLFLLDQFTSVAASHAILTGLVARQLHGRGQEMTLSLLGAAMWFIQTNLVSSSVMNVNADTTWDRRRQSPLRNTIPTSDGGWIVGTNHPEPMSWPIFCEAIGRPELTEDPRFASSQDRANNVEILNDLIEEIFLTRPRDEWLDILVGQHGLKFMPVLTMQEALHLPQAELNGYVGDIEHPVLGRIRVPNHPVGFGTYASAQTAPAPVNVGEDTLAVLREHGYSPEAIHALHQDAVIGGQLSPDLETAGAR